MKRRDLLLAVLVLILLWEGLSLFLHQPILPSPLVVAVTFIR